MGHITLPLFVRVSAMQPIFIGWDWTCGVAHSEYQINLLKMWGKISNRGEMECLEISPPTAQEWFFDIIFNITDEQKINRIFVKGKNLYCGINIFTSLPLGNQSGHGAVECSVSPASDNTCIFSCPRHRADVIPDVVQVRVLPRNKFMHSNQIKVCKIRYDL